MMLSTRRPGWNPCRNSCRELVEELVDSATEEMTDGAAKASTSVAHVAVVSLDEEESEEEIPGLVDVEILMTIFGFIDAMDILNMAQINLTRMYNKIDNIFGISDKMWRKSHHRGGMRRDPLQSSIGCSMGLA